MNKKTQTLLANKMKMNFPSIKWEYDRIGTPIGLRKVRGKLGSGFEIRARRNETGQLFMCVWGRDGFERGFRYATDPPNVKKTLIKSLEACVQFDAVKEALRLVRKA